MNYSIVCLILRLNHYIDTSMVSNTKIESRANRGAFYIMLNHYPSETGIEPQDFNILHFANSYNLESKHLLFIRNVAEQELGIKISHGAFIL